MQRKQFFSLFLIVSLGALLLTLYWITTRTVCSSFPAPDSTTGLASTLCSIDASSGISMFLLFTMTATGYVLLVTVLMKVLKLKLVLRTKR